MGRVADFSMSTKTQWKLQQFRLDKSRQSPGARRNVRSPDSHVSIQITDYIIPDSYSVNDQVGSPIWKSEDDFNAETTFEECSRS